MLWRQTWSQEPSSCTRHPRKWPWETDASQSLKIPKNLPWGIYRLLHDGQNPSILSKRSGTNSAKGCSWIHPLRAPPVGFSTEGIWPPSSVYRTTLRLAESWNESVCSPLICELHRYCAVQYLLLIWSGEQFHVVNKKRGMNSLSFILLPCLWTKKKLTCLVLTLQKLWQFVQMLFMLNITLFNGLGTERSGCWLCQWFTSWTRVTHSICKSFNTCTKELRIPPLKLFSSTVKKIISNISISISAN